MTECNPNKYTCSVEQWFDEEGSKPIVSRELGETIDRAVELRKIEELSKIRKGIFAVKSQLMDIYMKH